MKKEVKPRSLDAIATSLKTRARDSAIDNGELLLEAQAQLNYGQFVEWLEEHWDRSIATAYNFMRAAEFAARFPNVRKLKLRAGALYRLSNIEDLDEAFRERVFAEAARDWVTADRLDEIERELYPPSPPPEEEPADESGEEDSEGDDFDPAPEAAKILDGEPPELPPDPPPEMPRTGQAEAMFFDQTINRLMTMRSKPIATFDAVAARRSEDLGAVASFLHELITRTHSRSRV
jgi:hypothetical protein